MDDTESCLYVVDAVERRLKSASHHAAFRFAAVAGPQWREPQCSRRA